MQVFREMAQVINFFTSTTSDCPDYTNYSTYLVNGTGDPWISQSKATIFVSKTVSNFPWYRSPAIRGATLPVGSANAFYAYGTKRDNQEYKQYNNTFKFNRRLAMIWI